MTFKKDNNDNTEVKDNRRGKKNDRQNNRQERPKTEFTESLLEVRRVTKVTTGWRRMTFRATILIGNKKGKIGIWVAKGKDVSIAVKKATHEAYKNISVVPITEGLTIPYPIVLKNKASVIKMIPAAWGTWLKAGSSVRMVLELAGYANMLSKIIGTNNKLNNALTTVLALTSMKISKKAPKTTANLDSKDTEISSDKEKKTVKSTKTK